MLAAEDERTSRRTPRRGGPRRRVLRSRRAGAGHELDDFGRAWG